MYVCMYVYILTPSPGYRGARIAGNNRSFSARKIRSRRGPAKRERSARKRRGRVGEEEDQDEEEENKKEEEPRV